MAIITKPSELARRVRDDSGILLLGETAKYVNELFESPAEVAFLTLSLRDERLTISCGRMDGEERAHGFVTFVDEPELQQSAREFFIAHGLKLPSDDWTPAQIIPGLPVRFTYSISPFPPGAAAIASLIVELFRFVCGLKDDAQLKFQRYEVAKAS